MRPCISVHALASGSSGNATLVRNESVSILIDAGIGIRSLTAALAAHHLVPSDLSAVLITHEHGDHAQSAYTLARKHNVKIVANELTLGAVFGGRVEQCNVLLPVGDCWRVGDLSIQTFPVPHDAAEPVGINVVHSPSGDKVSYITDAGHVTEAMRSAIRKASLVILEANHDVHRLTLGSYPGPLKARILGTHGHLSNEAAVDLLCEHALNHGPFTAWLAHLSKENNTPKLALGYARATVAVKTGCPIVLDVARRDRPSASWSPGRSALQLSLF